MQGYTNEVQGIDLRQKTTNYDCSHCTNYSCGCSCFTFVCLSTLSTTNRIEDHGSHKHIGVVPHCNQGCGAVIESKKSLSSAEQYVDADHRGPLRKRAQSIYQLMSTEAMNSSVRHIDGKGAKDASHVDSQLPIGFPFLELLLQNISRGGVFEQLSQERKKDSPAQFHPQMQNKPSWKQSGYSAGTDDVQCDMTMPIFCDGITRVCSASILQEGRWP